MISEGLICLATKVVATVQYSTSKSNSDNAVAFRTRTLRPEMAQLAQLALLTTL
jgi:hypothetical protein